MKIVHHEDAKHVQVDADEIEQYGDDIIQGIHDQLGVRVGQRSVAGSSGSRLFPVLPWS